METATSEMERTRHEEPAGAARVEPTDPEHDINAKATVTWVLAWTGILVIGLWFMLQLFDAVLFDERRVKVETRDPAELQRLREQERAILSGEWEAGAPRKSIDEVMREMAK